MSRAIIVLLSLPMLLAACGGPRPRPWGSLIVAPGQPIPLALAAATADAPNLALTAGRVAAAAGPIDGHALSVTALPVGCAAADPMSAAVDTRALRNSAGVIGPMCSTACVYSEGALYAKRLTMITPSCTAAAVVQQGFPIAFRLAWDDNDQAVLSARYARAGLHAGRAAVVGDKTIYGVALTTVFKDVFRGAGGSVVAASSLSAAGGDLGGLARAIRSAHADVVFVAVGGSEAGAVLRTLRQALPATPMLTSDTAVAGAAATCSAGAARGSAPLPPIDDLYVATGLTRSDGVWGSELDSVAARGCVDFGAELADAVHLYARAIASVAKRQANGSLMIPRQALRDAIARAKVSGESGKIAFDPFGERLTDVGAELYRDVGGRAVAVKTLEH